MTLGQRIRAARQERQMTQQELVGNYITRNMLSKIENDAAAPSVRTLEYLAGVMGLSPGAFLADPPCAGREEGFLVTLTGLLEKGDPDFSEALASALEEWEETGMALRLLQIRHWLKTGELGNAAALLAALSVPAGHKSRFAYCLASGQVHAAQDAYETALPFLREAEALAEGQPEAAMKALFAALEDAYHKTGDFRRAYYYAKARPDRACGEATPACQAKERVL